MTRIRCVAERVTYQNPDNGYSVLKVRIKGYVRNTFERLSASYGPAKAKEMIAAVLLEEMYGVLKGRRPLMNRTTKRYPKS